VLVSVTLYLLAICGWFMKACVVFWIDW